VGTHLWWYTARASGFVAWGLLTAAVVWGLAFVSRATKRPRPAWVLDLHRFLGGCAVVFVGVHLVALSLDSYVGFGPADLLVPLASRWKPGAVAWGVVALYVLLAVELTSLAMRRLPRKLWRWVHLSSYFAFASTIVHALAAGTDAGEPVVQWFALASVGLVSFLTLFRALADRRPALRASPRAVETGDLAA
jgi:DMSO/TMAO reductase YedYZ heme-binding membrane subunit